MSWNDEALLEGAAQAIRDFVATGKAYEITHPVQITSIGGSGTTAVVRHLLAAGVEIQPGPAQWPFKHRRRTPAAADVPDGFRVLYLIGDPRDAVLSVFRRGIQKGHFLALNDDPRDPEPAALARLESLDAFLAAGVDDFRLADHIAGWLHHPPGYEVMVLRFDLIETVWPEVATFVGLPADHPPIVLRERHSEWRELAEPNRTRLEEMYGELAARIEAMPAVQVV